MKRDSRSRRGRERDALRVKDGDDVDPFDIFNSFFGRRGGKPEPRKGERRLAAAPAGHGRRGRHRRGGPRIMYRGDKGRRRGGLLFESGPTVTVPAAAGAAAAASSLGHESAGVRAGIGKPGRHIKLAAQVPDAGSLSGHRRSSSPRQRRRGRHGASDSERRCRAPDNNRDLSAVIG